MVITHTNRPPKGDRSEGFSSIFIDFSWFSTIFLENQYFYLWKLSRDGGGWVQDIFGNIFHLRNLPEDPILSPKTSNFWFSDPHLKILILTFRPKPSFWVTNPSIHAVQNVRMDHRDHFRFHRFLLFRPANFHQDLAFWQNVTFWYFCLKIIRRRHVLFFSR